MGEPGIERAQRQLEARPFSLRGKRVWVAGHRGMVGAALVRRLAREGCEIATVGRDSVDLIRQGQVEDWVARTRPQAVFMAAAKVGGILANSTYPADFLYDNLMIEANIISGLRRPDVEKLVFLGSSCIYPKLAPQPIPEYALLTGPSRADQRVVRESPRLPASSCARPTDANTAAISSQPCRPIFTAPVTTTTSRPVTSSGADTQGARGQVSNSAEMVIWGSGNAAPRVPACRRLRRRVGPDHDAVLGR